MSGPATHMTVEWYVLIYLTNSQQKTKQLQNQQFPHFLSSLSLVSADQDAVIITDG